MLRPRNARVAVTLAVLTLVLLVAGTALVLQAGVAKRAPDASRSAARTVAPTAEIAPAAVVPAPARPALASRGTRRTSTDDTPWYTLEPWVRDRGAPSAAAVNARLTTEAGLAAEADLGVEPGFLVEAHEADPVFIETDALGSVIVHTGRRFEHRLVARMATDGRIEIGCEDHDGTHDPETPR